MSVYYVHAPELGLVKIGFAGDARQRFKKIQSDSPTRLALVAVEEGDVALEATRHEQFATLRRRGEWFEYSGELAALIERIGRPAPRIKKFGPNDLSSAVGISKSYASMILSGKQPPSRPLAIHIFRVTGWRHPSIAALTDEQLAVFEAVEPWTPRPTEARRVA